MGDHLRRYGWSGGTIYGSHTWSGGTVHSNIFCRRWSVGTYFGGTICGMTGQHVSYLQNLLRHKGLHALFCKLGHELYCSIDSSSKRQLKVTTIISVKLYYHDSTYLPSLKQNNKVTAMYGKYSTNSLQCTTKDTVQ